MEYYTLETTKIDFKKGRISKDEFDIIKKFIKTRDQYHNACDSMKKHFREKFADSINNAKVKDDLKRGRCNWGLDQPSQWGMMFSFIKLIQKLVCQIMLLLHMLHKLVLQHLYHKSKTGAADWGAN